MFCIGSYWADILFLDVREIASKYESCKIFKIGTKLLDNIFRYYYREFQKHMKEMRKKNHYIKDLIFQICMKGKEIKFEKKLVTAELIKDKELK